MNKSLCVQSWAKYIFELPAFKTIYLLYLPNLENWEAFQLLFYFRETMFCMQVTKKGSMAIMKLPIISCIVTQLEPRILPHLLENSVHLRPCKLWAIVY